MQNSAGTILQFELYPPLFTYNVEFYSSSNAIILEWLVSVPAVHLFLVSALSISFGLACTVEVTPLIGGLLMYFFKKFRVKGLHLGCMFKFRFRVRV